MGARIIPYELFDDGSIVCRNFTISTKEDYYYCEWEYIQKEFSKEIQDQIVNALKNKKRYLTFDGKVNGVLEISWD